MGYIVEMGELYLAPNYKRIPLAFVRGQGARLFTEDGVEYLDFTSGIAVCNLGHTHPRLVSALKNRQSYFGIPQTFSILSRKQGLP